MTEKELAISVRNVSKEFKAYYKSGTGSASSSSSPRTLSSLLGKSKYEKIQVLKDVSFDIMKGEMVGVLGRNGAGKSTLLQIVAGIIQPTKGSVKINGKITSLMGFGSGLDKKLTARENIMQYGLILGLPKAQVEERIEDVLEFAELEKYGDFQISHFSSGMNARLAFSTTLLVDPDILLLDEALAVGDYYFHKKSVEAFERIRKKSGTILLVSHQLGNIKRYCNRVMLLNDGKVDMMGEPDPVIQRYLELGLNDAGGTGGSSTKLQYEDEDIVEGPLPVNATAAAKSAESTAKPAISERATAAIEAPTNLFPDGSPFLEEMTKIPSRKLRWRAKVLVENNAFAIKDKSILDLRCQNGPFMHAALQSGAKYVEGIERQPELVEIANENLSTFYGSSNAENAKYKINKGSLLGVLRKVKPKTFDTIFCYGVMNKLINNTGLMQQIVRIQPTYLIIDVEVSQSSEAIMELDTGSEESKSSEDTESAGKNVSLPSKSAIELLLSTYKFKFDYVDWTKLGIINSAGLEDYLENKRLSIIASKL